MTSQHHFLPNTEANLNSLPEGSIINYDLSPCNRWEKRAAGWYALANPTYPIMDYPWTPELLLSYYEVEQGWEEFSIER